MTLLEPRDDAPSRPALILCAVMVAVAVALLPTAAVPLAPMRRFVFFQGGSLLTAYTITSYLMSHQFQYRRSVSVLLLMSAYVMSAALQVPLLLTYPGPDDGPGIPLGGPGSTAWLWHAWHAMFALLSLGYAVVEWRHAVWAVRRAGLALWGTLAATLTAAGLIAVGTIAGIALLPRMLDPSGRLALPHFVFGGCTLVVIAAAFPVLFLRDGQRKPMNLWLAVALAAAFGDVLVAMNSGGRYTLGWYCGRVYGLVTACALLLLFLREFGSLHRKLRLALARVRDSNERLEARVRERTAELQHALDEAQDAHEQLRQAEKVRVVGQLVAGVAHDFNNILQVVGGVLDVVREDIAPGSEAGGYVEAAARAAERGARLTHQLLSYARKQLLAPALVDLPALLGGVQALLARTLGSHITVELAIEADAPSVLVDGMQLQTALINLGINAAHAMPQGGRLRFEACRAAATEFPGLAPDDYTVIAAVDTGTGMTPETLARAFEPFFTTKGLDGTGLGLAMVQGFCRQSGGDARVISAPGQGTRVEVWLPSASRTAGGLAPTAPAPARPTGAGNILLVDDSPDVLLTVRAFLSKGGFTVRHAHSGDEALALLAAGERFDILITDYMMPGLIGSDLVEQARAMQPGLPVLIITGFSVVAGFDPEKQHAEVLRKPFKRDELIARINALLAAVTTPRRDAGG
jgi:signal transduction histidine kinase/ActR/RegA family two-component response regulator